jgi:ABC-type dipeptide/oligopeptide/nickel transport system permease component
MYQYFVRRLLLGLLTLLLITFLVYALIRLMPGDPLLVMLESARPDKPITTESIERMRAQFGLNDPSVYCTAILETRSRGRYAWRTAFGSGSGRHWCWR